MQKSCSDTNGVSLLELVIVITVIGLIAAGILLAQNLVKSSELQKVSSDFLTYRNAIKLFRDKYQYLPGDFPEAGNYWGSRTCNDTASDDTSTTSCNGNGDGYITGAGGTPNDLGTNYHEALGVWQHLANAGLVKGAYSGRAGVGVTWWKPGTNIPKGLSDVGGYNISYAGVGSSSVAVSDTYLGAGNRTIFNANYGHIITYGNSTSRTKTQTPTGLLLSPADAAVIDAKIDDGKPAFGNILATATTFNGGATYQCVTSASPKGSNYLTSTEGNSCVLLFITGM